MTRSKGNTLLHLIPTQRRSFKASAMEAEHPCVSGPPVGLGGEGREWIPGRAGQGYLTDRAGRGAAGVTAPHLCPPAKSTSLPTSVTWTLDLFWSLSQPAVQPHREYGVQYLGNCYLLDSLYDFLKLSTSNFKVQLTKQRMALLRGSICYRSKAHAGYSFSLNVFGFVCWPKKSCFGRWCWWP